MGVTEITTKVLDAVYFWKSWDWFSMMLFFVIVCATVFFGWAMWRSIVLTDKQNKRINKGKGSGGLFG